MSRIALALVVLCACGGSPVHPTTYPDGRTEEVSMRNGLRHGRFRTFSPSGTLQSEGAYVAGKREGMFTYYLYDGSFDAHALFINDEEVWRSSDPNAMPDLQQLSRVRRKQLDEALAPTRAQLPVPWFSSIDRTTTLDRAGIQYGFGGPESLSFGSVQRLEVFGNYTHGDLGGYGQFSQTSLAPMTGSRLTGRQTLEGGATYRLPLEQLGVSTARLGVLLPVGHDDGDGFVASTAGSFQRPTDAVASVPSSIALRMSANATRVLKRFVVQGDLGVDWIMGGEPRPLDALLRGNIGVGFGSRTALLSLEVTNTVALTNVDRRLHGIGFGGSVRIAKAWLSGVLSYCISGDTSLTAAVGYEL